MGNYLAGTPEQLADELADWGENGVDGFNLMYSVTPGTFADFVDGVVPVLQARGLMQRDYEPGPLRQKLFGARPPRRAPPRRPPPPRGGECVAGAAAHLIWNRAELSLKLWPIEGFSVTPVG